MTKQSSLRFMPLAVLLSYACGMSPTDPRHLVPYLPTFELDRSEFATYPTLSTQLQLIARDSQGVTITGLRESWSSSNRSVATVDANGLVTAVAPGTAVISATSQKRGASTTITVLARPVPDWSNASEDWSAFQGGPAHTGFVPVTLDPVLFKTAWSVAVSPGYAIKGTAAGDGMLFVSTSKPAQQIVVALDAQTGAQRWSANAGVAEMLSPPTFANSTVYVQTNSAASWIWVFDAANGALKKTVTSPYSSGNAGGWGPVIVGNRLYAAVGGYGPSGVRALNTDDWSPVWFTDVVYTPPTPTFADGAVYTYGDHALSVLDAVTGARAYAIPDGTAEAFFVGFPVAASPNEVIAVHDAGREELICFDLRNRTVKWRVSGRFERQVTVANGVVYVYNRDVATDPLDLEAYRVADGVLLWSWSAPQGLSGAPIVATNNLVFVSATTSADSATYAVDINTHLEAWRYPVAGSLSLSTQGFLFISQGNGTITAISLK